MVQNFGTSRKNLVLLILLCSLFCTDALISLSKRPQPFGALKLCPTGGQAFMMAWSLACEVKRKKRQVEVPDYVTGFVEKRSVNGVPNGYRPATLTEIMNICCHLGCEIRDLLPYCDPFGAYNS